jgi:hypothetical protein
MIQEKADREFKEKQDQTKNDRLKYLLKQTEIFTHFILSHKKKGPINGGMIKEALAKGEEKGDFGGKSSVSKRHTKKSSKNAAA